MKAPWPYSLPPAPGAASIPNEPTPEGAALGREVARFADIEAERQPGMPERCDECAFRLGTDANACGPTLMNAVKCGIEDEIFYCHKDVPEGDEPIRPCAGFMLLLKGTR